MKETCTECGNESDFENGIGENESFRCYDCYRASLTDCMLCEEGVEEDQVSPYIVVKTEFAETGGRLPGIYRIRQRPFMTSAMIGGGWIHGGDVLFIDRLPKADAFFEISGNICFGCAEKHGYPSADSRVYGRTKDTEILRRKERRHVQGVVAEHPEMLRDLETDAVDEDFQRWCPLPVFAPTYHELLFLDHHGVRVFWTGGRSVTWLTIRPEPRFRNTSCFPGGIIFAPTGLKTWEPIKLDPNRSKDRHGKYFDDGYRYGSEHDFIEAARQACIRAIDKGLITTTHAPEDAR